MFDKLFGGDARDDANEPGLRDRETRIRERMHAQGITEEEATRLVLSEEELAIGKRQVEAGSVGVGKRVEEEVVSREVPVTHEEVVVERRPASGMAAADTAFRESEIEVPITQEEVVVEKRVVPTEELVVRKQEVTDTETVRETLRHEEAEIHRQGDVRLREEGTPGEIRRDDRF